MDQETHTPREARTFIACTFSIMVVFGLCYYITHAEDKNAYAVCTIKSHKIEAIGGQASNYTVESPKGIFETDECGTLEMYGDVGWKKRYRSMYLRFMMERSTRHTNLRPTKIKIKTSVSSALKKSKNNQFMS